MSGIDTISTTPDPDNFSGKFCFCLFVSLVALQIKSTAMVMAGRSVPLTTLFPGNVTKEQENVTNRSAL